MDSFTRSSSSSVRGRTSHPHRSIRCAHPVCKKECTQLRYGATHSIAAVSTDRIDLVLFDLGGVLIQPGGVASMRALAGIDSDEELWTRWLACPWVQRFEAGLCSPEEFADGVVADWDLEL